MHEARHVLSLCLLEEVQAQLHSSHWRFGEDLILKSELLRGLVLEKRNLNGQKIGKEYHKV